MSKTIQFLNEKIDSIKIERDGYKLMITASFISKEHERLVEEIRQLKLEKPGINSNGEDVRYFKSKIYHYDKLVAKLESEKGTL